MNRLLSALIPAALVLTAPLSAHANLELAKKNACMACQGFVPAFIRVYA